MRTSYMMTILIVVIIVTASGYYWTTIQTPETVQIQQKGSDTLLVLAQNWEAYMSQHSNVEIVVSGGGSGTGISALINKQIDISDASRQIKQMELDAAKEVGVNPVEWKVALDGISIIVNKANDIEELSYDQLRGLYNGSVTN